MRNYTCRIREHRQPQADPQGEEGRPRPARAAQVPEKRLKAQGSDHHRLDFALSDPQVCVDDLFGHLYPKRERGGSTPSLQGLRDVRKTLAHDQYTDVDMVNAHPVILSVALSEARTGVSRPGEVRARAGGGVG